MTPLFTQCVEEVAHKCNLAYKHRTLQGYHTYDAYEELFSKSRSNLAVVYAWLVGKRKSGCRMWTDSQTLYSYQLVIGITQPDGYKVMRHGTGCAQPSSYYIGSQCHCPQLPQFRTHWRLDPWLRSVRFSNAQRLETAPHGPHY